MYAYVGNDPINAVDPTGMDSCDTVNPDGTSAPRIDNCIGDASAPSTPIGEAHGLENMIVVTANRLKKPAKGTDEKKVKRSLKKRGEWGFQVVNGQFAGAPLPEHCHVGETVAYDMTSFADPNADFAGHTHGSDFLTGLGPNDAQAAQPHPSGKAMQYEGTGLRMVAKTSTGSAVAISSNGRWGELGRRGARNAVNALVAIQKPATRNSKVAKGAKPPCP